MVFRDEKGYPKAIWDTNAKKWLRPEETDIPWTREKWEKVFDLPFIGNSGKEGNYNVYFEDNGSQDFFTKKDIDKIRNLPDGTWITVFNPSGEADFWVSKEEAISRLEEGAFAVVGNEGDSLSDKNENVAFLVKALWNVAFNQYEKGDRSLFVVVGDVGVTRDKIKGIYSPGTPAFEISKIPQVIDESTGQIVCPVIRAPKYFNTAVKDSNGNLIEGPTSFHNFDFWLDELLEAGAVDIVFESIP